MKKSLFILTILMAASSMFTSCNKKLKDDMSDLEKEIANLKGQVNDVKSILGSNEPITATTTFVDHNDSTRTITDTYKFKAGNNSTQSLKENYDGTYDIYIERFSDVEWYEGAWVEFTYDPQTKTISDQRGGQYWDDEDAYRDYTRFYDEDCSITINSIDLKTGNISLSFSGTSNDSNYGPTANGNDYTTKFNFTGKLKLFPKETIAMKK